MGDYDDDYEGGGPVALVNEDDIILEGYLRVRASKGIAGLKPWLLR
jgi:hypothetical protein